MASDSEASCISDPNFAVICGFLEKFGELCAVKHPDFLDLQEMLENTQEVSPHLIDLHIKLLRRGKRSVSSDKWEKALIKFCHCYCSQDAWELERFGYKKARLSSKLNILKNLCEMQFDSNAKFKAEVNRLTSSELRSQPIGRDKFGHSYWYQIDDHCQLRVYREDPDEETWTLVARDREGLVRLIQQLTSGDVGEMVLNEDSNSLEIEKPIIDTGQTSLSTESCEIEGEESCNANDETKINATVEKKPDSQTDLKSDIKIQKNDPSSLKITISTKGTSYVKEDLSVEKKENQDETPTETTFVQFTQQSKSVDFSNKKKKSINELAANLRNKTTDLLARKSDVDQEINLSVTTPRIRVKQFSSLSEPPILPICAIENEFQMTETEEDAEEDDEFFQSDLLELPIQLKQTRLLRPTLLSNTKKKTYSDEEQEYGEEIEEPLMLIQGEGSGKDCNNENLFKNEETEYGEIIEETVMYFYGEGSGHDCTTGNTGKEDKNTSDTNNSGDKQDSSCLKSSQKEDLNSEAHHSSDLHCKSLKLKSVRIEEKCTSKDVGNKEDSKVISERPTVQSTESKSSKVGKIIFDIKSVDRSTLPVKKLSRWDVGKPSKDLNEKNTDSSKPGDITKNSINEAKLVQFDSTSKKFDTTEAPVHISDIDKASVSEKTLDSKSASSAGIKPTFFFGPRSACIQFSSAVTSNTTQITTKQDLSETTSQTQQTTSSSEKSSEKEKVSSNYENVPTKVTKADILLKNDPSVFLKDEKNLSVFKKPDSAVSDYSSVLKNETNSERKHLLISDSDSKPKKRENDHLSENISKNVLIISSPMKELGDEKQGTGDGEITKHKKDVAGENIELSKVNPTNVVSEKDTNDTKSANISTSNKSCLRNDEIKSSDMIKKSSSSSGLLTDLKEVSDYLEKTSKNDHTEIVKEAKANKPDKKSETLLETLESLSTLLETESDDLSTKKQEKTTVKEKVQKDSVAEKSVLNLPKQSKNETLDTNKEQSKVQTQASEISSSTTESKHLIDEVKTKQAIIELSAPTSKSSVKNDIISVNTELKLESCGKESSVQLHATTSYETDGDKITKSTKLPAVKNLAEQKIKDNKSKNETSQIESNINITDASTKSEGKLPLCSIDSKESKCSKKLRTSTITAEKQANLPTTEKPNEKTKCYNAQPSRTEEVLQITDSLCSTNVPNINLKIASTKESKALKNELIVLKKSDTPSDETDREKHQEIILDELSVKESDNETKNEKCLKVNILSTELKEDILAKQESSVEDQIKSDGAKMETKIISEGSLENMQNLKIDNTKYEQAKQLLKETCDTKELSSEKGINLIKDKPVIIKEHKKVLSSESFKIENLVAKEKTNEKLTEYTKISQIKSSTEKCKNSTDDVSHKEKINKSSTPTVEQIKTLKETSISVEKSKEPLIRLLSVTKQKENYDKTSVSISNRVENPATTSTSVVTHKEVAKTSILDTKKDDVAKTVSLVSTLQENVNETTELISKLEDNVKTSPAVAKKNVILGKITELISKPEENVKTLPAVAKKDVTLDKISATVSKLEENVHKKFAVKQEKIIDKISPFVSKLEENLDKTTGFLPKLNENLKSTAIMTKKDETFDKTPASVSKLVEDLDKTSIVKQEKNLKETSILIKNPEENISIAKQDENSVKTSLLISNIEQNLSQTSSVSKLEEILDTSSKIAVEQEEVLKKTLVEKGPDKTSTSKVVENIDTTSTLVVKQKQNITSIVMQLEKSATLESVTKNDKIHHKTSSSTGKSAENYDTSTDSIGKLTENPKIIASKDENLNKALTTVLKLEESSDKKSKLAAKQEENTIILESGVKRDENLDKISVSKLEESRNKTTILKPNENLTDLAAVSKKDENLNKTTSVLKLEEKLDKNLKSVLNHEKNIKSVETDSKLTENPDKTTTSILKFEDTLDQKLKPIEEKNAEILISDKNIDKTTIVSKLEKYPDKTPTSLLKLGDDKSLKPSKRWEESLKTSKPVRKQEDTFTKTATISKLEKNLEISESTKTQGENLKASVAFGYKNENCELTSKSIVKHKENFEIASDSKLAQPVVKQETIIKTSFSKKDENSDKTSVLISKLEENVSQTSTSKVEGSLDKTVKDVIKQKEVRDQKISADTKETKPDTKSTLTENITTSDSVSKLEKNQQQTSISTPKLEIIIGTTLKTVEQKVVKDEKVKNISADIKETQPESKSACTRKYITFDSSFKQENLPQTSTSTSKLDKVLDIIAKTKEVKEEQTKNISADTKKTKPESKAILTGKGTTSYSSSKQEDLPPTLTSTSKLENIIDTTLKTVVEQKEVKEEKIQKIAADPKETISDSKSTLAGKNPVSDSISQQEENLSQTSTSTSKLDVILESISKTIVQQKEAKEANIASDSKETKTDSKSAIIRKDTTSDSISEQEKNLPKTSISTSKLEVILDTTSKTVVKQKEVKEERIKNIFVDVKETKPESKSILTRKDTTSDSSSKEENLPQTSTSTLKLENILDTSKTVIEQKEVEEEKIQKIIADTTETKADSKTILTGKDTKSHSISKLEENLPQITTSTPKLDEILDKTLKTVVKQKEIKELKNAADTKETKPDLISSITKKDITSDCISKQETTTSTSKLDKMLDTTSKTVVKQKEVEKEKIQKISTDTKQIKPDSKFTLTKKEVTSDFILKQEEKLSQTSTSTSKLNKVLGTISKTKEIKEEKIKNIFADTKETKPESKSACTRKDTVSYSSSKQENLPHTFTSTSKLENILDKTSKTFVEQKEFKEDKIKKFAADINETEPDSKTTLTDSISKQKESLSQTSTYILQPKKILDIISKPIEKQKENLVEEILQKTFTLKQDEYVGKTSVLVVEQQENIISSFSSSKRKNVDKMSTSVLKLEDKDLKPVEKEEKTLQALATVLKPEENVDKTSTLVSEVGDIDKGLISDQKLGKNLKTFFVKQEDNLSKITEMVSKLDKTSKSVKKGNEHRQTSVSVEKEVENVGKSSLSSHKPQDPEMKTTQKKSFDKSATGISKIIIERESTNKIDASEETNVNENILTVTAKIEEPSLEIAKAELQIQTLATARLVDKHVSPEKEKSEQVKLDTNLGLKKDIIETSKDKLESKKSLEKGDVKLVAEIVVTQKNLDAEKLEITEPKITLTKSLDSEVNTKKEESNPNISEIDKTTPQSAKIIASKISHQNRGVSSTKELTKEEEGEIEDPVSKALESNKKKLKDSVNKTIQESTSSLDLSVNKKTFDKTTEKIDDNIDKPKPEKSSIKILEEPISLCQEKSKKENVTNLDGNQSEKSKISPKTDPTSSHTEKGSLIKEPVTVQFDEQQIEKTDTKSVVTISKKPLSSKTPNASVKSNEETEDGKKTILEKCTVETEETIAEKDTSEEKFVNKIIVKDLSKLIGNVEDFSAKEAGILHSETKIDSIDKQKLNEETDLNIVEKKYEKMGTRSETSKRKIIVYDVEKEKDKLVKSISKQEESSISITKTIGKKAGITKKPEPFKSDVNASKTIGEATSISKIVNVNKNELTENISSQITISKVMKTPIIKAQSTSDLIIGEVQIKKVPAVDFIKVSKQMTKTLPTSEITIKPIEKSPPSKVASSCDLMIGEVKIKKVTPSTSEKPITSAVKVSGNLIGEVKIKKVVTETQRESRSSSFKKKVEIENTADFDDSSDDMLDSTDFGGDSYMGQSDKSDNEDNDDVIIVPNMSKNIECVEKPKRGRPKKLIARENELPKLKIKSVADLNKSSGLKDAEQDQKQASKVICIDISKLKDAPTKPTTKKISELKQSSSSLSQSVISIGEDDDGSNDVLDVPETDPLACSEDEITQTNKQKEPTPSVTKGLSLATFKMDDTEADTSLLPEPLARALRNRKIIAAAPPKIRKRVKSTEVKVEPKVETKPVINKNVRLTRRSLQMEKELEVSSSDDESTEKSVSTSKVMKTTPKRGGARGRRGRGRGGWLTQTSRVSNDSPAVSVSSDAPSEASKADITPEKKSTKKIRRVLGLDIDPSTIIVPIEKDDSETIPTTRSSVRQSRRIAQIKIKEQAERRDIEEITQMIETNEFEKKKKKKKSHDKEYKMDKKKLKKHKVTSEEEEEDESETEVTDPKKKHKKKRKHQDMKKLFNVSNPWQSSSESDEEEEHEEEEYEEDQSEVEVEQVLKSDHEFSPESDLETAEVQPLRRARTVKKESDTEDPTDEHACQKCGKSDHPEWILLCDKCDCGWHCSCLRPALLVIPEGDWFCPPCQHIALIGALQVQLEEFDKKINRMDLEERRKERLAYVGISLANVLPTKDGDEKEQQSASSSSSESESSSGSSSADDSEPIYQLRERRQAHSYRFNDYDELINSAIQDELEAVKGAGNQGRGKDIATIVNAEKEEAKAQALLERNDELLPVVPTSEETPQPQKTASDEDSEDELRVVPKHAGRKKHRKLNALDVSSEEDDNNDEDFKGTSEEEEEDIDDVASDDSDSDMGRRGKRGGPIRRSTRARTQRYDKEFINDDTDEEQARKKRKSMWDESESEESDKDWGQKKRSKKQRQFPTSRFSKKSKKKRKREYDSDPDTPRKPKAKRPRIQFGGLNDSDEDETLGRRTRGKKMNYLDVLDTDSEEEKRPTRKIIDSEDEYVANEEDDDEHEEAVDDVEEEKDSESESDIQKPLVMPRTVLMLPPKGRGKAGIPRHVKPSEPPIPPIIIQKSNILPEQEASVEEESLPVDKMKEIPIIAANPDNLDEEEVETMMMESEEYANKQLELMAIQLAKEKKKKEMELEMAEDIKDDEQMSSTDVQTALTNIQLPSINVQLPSTNVQLPSDTMQMSPSSVQMSPSNVQMSPVAIQMPPTNMHMPPSNLQMSPSNIQMSPSNIQMPPSNIQFPLSNVQIPPSNVQMQMSPSNMQLSPSSAQFPPRNIQFPPSNVQMPPSNLQMPLTNIQMPPSSIQMPPSNVQMPPSNVQFSPLNIQLPSTHTQFSPTSAQLPSPSNVQLPQTNVPPLQKTPKKRGRKRKVDIEAAAALAAAAAGLEGDMQTVLPITISKAKMNKNLTPQLQSDELKGELNEEGNVPTVVSELQTASPPKRRGRGKGKKALEKEKAAAVAAALAAGLPIPDTPLPEPSKPIQMSGTIVPPITTNPMIPKQTDLPIDPNLPGKLGIAAPPQPFSQSQPTPSVITRMLQSQPMPAAQNFTQAANNMAQKYFSNMHDQPPRGVQPGQFSPMAARGGRGPSPYRQSPPTMNMFPGLRPGPASSPHRLRSPGPPMQPMFHNTHHAMDPSPSGGGPISITAVSRDRNSPVMPPTANSPLAQKDGPPPQLPPPYNRAGLTINRFPLNENSPGPSLPSHTMQDRQIRQHLFVQSTAAHIQQPSPPPRQPPPGGNFSPYHPPPPNYHYGTYPPAPTLAAADDALPPTDYQGSPYPEHYAADGPVNSSEGSNSKPFDEEGSGEFGGLVSYFSSQREDDLDT